jgi:AcrR family transcriptional regulator
MPVPQPAKPRAAPPDLPVHEDAVLVIGRRQRKKLALRAAIRHAVLRLAIRDGIENVTVEQIATEADIGLRTFFNHYSCKEEAVVVTASNGAEHLIAEFRLRPRTESVLQALREAVLVVMDDSDVASHEYIETLRLIQTAPSLAPHRSAVLAGQEQALADAIAERLDTRPATGPVAPVSDHDRRDAVYPSICAAAALAALRVVLDRWLSRSVESGDTPPLAVLRTEFDQAFTELAAGLDRPGIEPESATL